MHLLVAALGSAMWTIALKNFIQRVRPTEIHPLVESLGFSYPSGHSLSSTAIFVTIAIIGSRQCPAKQRVYAVLLAMMLSGLVALTRIYLGVHYPSDVLSGFFFGSAWAFLLASCFANFTPEAKS
ncbi:MAG: phosphatase PAP2 family protein [Bdellovibrionota bacterium]